MKAVPRYMANEKINSKYLICIFFFSNGKTIDNNLKFKKKTNEEENKSKKKMKEKKQSLLRLIII